MISEQNEMTTRIYTYDWSQTPIGPIENWPQNLKTAVGIMLNAKARIGIYWGADLILLYNDAWKKLIGDKHPLALGRPAREVFSEMWETIGPRFAHVMSGRGGLEEFQQKLPLKKFGRIEDAWFEYSFSPLVCEDGSIGGVFNIAVDATDRMLAEQKHRESEDRLSFVMENSDDNLFLQDLDLRYIWVSKPAQPFTHQDYLGRTDMQLEGPKEQLAYLTEVKRRVIETGQPTRLELSLNPKGESRYFQATFKPWHNQTGKVIGLVGYVRDITKRKTAELAIEASEKLYRNTFENAAVGIAHISPDGRLVRVNRKLCDLLGYNEQELLKKTFQEITHPDDIEKDLALAQRLGAGKLDHYDLEKRYIRKDGRIVWARLSAAMQSNDLGVGLVQDITEQKRMEDALRRAHEELEIRVQERTAELKEKTDELEKLNDILNKYNKMITGEHARRMYLSKRLVELLEAERRQIAMTLHDQVGQDMVTLKMDLEMLGSRLPEGTESDPHLSSAKRKAADIIRYMRDFSQSLRPDVLDTLGLCAGIRSMIDRVKQQDRGVDIRFFSAKESYPIDLDKMTALYRICQEALTNCIKHAAADTIDITLTERDNKVSLSIEDSGRGFDYQKVSGFRNIGQGFQGISIMRERAIQLGGEFWVETSPDKGTMISTWIPIESGDKHGEA